MAWPAYLICGLFLGELTSQSKRWLLRPQNSWQRTDHALQFAQMAIVTFSLCLLFATALHCRERVGIFAGWLDYRESYQKYKNDWNNRVRPVQHALETESEDTPVLVLSARDHLWHLFLQRPSALTNGGFNHIFDAREIDDICRRIEHKEVGCVVWDETYLQTPMPEIAYSYVSNPEKIRLLESLQRGYRIHTISSGPGDIPFSIWVPSDDCTAVTSDQELNPLARSNALDRPLTESLPSLD